MDPSIFSRSLMSPPVVKTEAAEAGGPPLLRTPAAAASGGGDAMASAAPEAVIDLSSSDSDSDGEAADGGSSKRARGAGGDGSAGKRARVSPAVDLPPGFLEPIPPPQPVAPAASATKQFWKAGDYDGKPLGDGVPQPSALAELLDNALDEVINGATYVNIDMLENDKDSDKEKSRMLLVEDDGGGMDPDKMRQCMSLGYSVKSKVPSTIGQYGNGFKTSTMRLGADVLVFSRSRAKSGKSTLDDWNTSLRTITTWSPYSTEAELLEQFSFMKEQGTRIIIYNLWEDDQGDLELDFDADVHDIQLRGGNRDEKNIQMAMQFPNSKHFLTYRHSLRSYASILYLRLPNYFQMILCGKEIEHHNIVTDMMLKKEVTYRPVAPNGRPKDSNVNDNDLKNLVSYSDDVLETQSSSLVQMVADVTIGFVKDAKHHIDVQGFNVYHKNRLIKPFWRVWTAAGSGGRGVIGVLEANFIEPAHDKQDFERTTLLARLEARLIQMQKDYWSGNAHRIGYVAPRPGRNSEAGEGENSPENTTSAQPSPYLSGKGYTHSKDLHSSKKSGKAGTSFGIQQRAEKSARIKRCTKSILHGLPDSDGSDSEFAGTPSSRSRSHTLNRNQISFQNGSIGLTESERDPNATSNGGLHTIVEYETVIKQLKDENTSLKERLSKTEESMSQELVMERDKNKSLTERVEDLQRKLECANKEQEALIDIFSEERARRDLEEDGLRNKLKVSRQVEAALACCRGRVVSFRVED
ncbi:hypothetical protein HU200_001246 [Digitaria exilis]|uniref:Morc S5 domain-containing protein n=1 Tax=Digitaria exilis TaxID=1010633 RepID=A0A835G1G5_9POAL|nr:hypothetical protein HU200_001246 [Digitaria exilis]